MNPSTAQVGLLSAGALASYWIYQKAPELEPEDAQNFAKAMFGLGATAVVYYIVSSKYPGLLENLR